MMRWIINMLQHGNKIFSRSWWKIDKKWKLSKQSYLVFVFCFFNFTNAKNTGWYWKFPGKDLTLQWIDLSCLSVMFLNSVFLTLMPEKFYILSSWSCLKWNMRGRMVFGTEKAILEEPELKYWKNHTRFWSIKWKSKNLQETLRIWAVLQSLPRSGGVAVLISMGFGLALQG